MDFHRIQNILSQHTLTPPEWKGAVLFLCNEEHVFLIRRSDSMPTHSGQIAFVGGHKKESETPWDVAQREFEEETSHSRSLLRLMGYLPIVFTARNQPIVPVVAELIMPSSEFLTSALTNGEWDEILAYPWSKLMEESKWEFAWRYGLARSPVMFHTIESGSYLAPEMNTKPHLLWGATAQMIWTMLKLYFQR